jgi:hypothetical protein
MAKIKEDPIDENDVLKKVGEAITEKPICIEFNLDKPLTENGEKVLKYSLKPIKVGNMYRIATQVRQIPDELLKELRIDALSVIMDAIFDHIDKLIYIVAVGLQNNADEPDEGLIQLIRKEFDIIDIVKVYNAIMVQMNLKGFITSIILIKGADILKISDERKMSPKSQEEIIAPGE